MKELKDQNFGYIEYFLRDSWIPGEEPVKEDVLEYYLDLTKSYCSLKAKRNQEIRTGSHVELREDLYSVMWLYHFKPEHVLGISLDRNSDQAEDTDRSQNEPTNKKASRV